MQWQYLVALMVFFWKHRLRSSLQLRGYVYAKMISFKASKGNSGATFAILTSIRRHSIPKLGFSRMQIVDAV